MQPYVPLELKTNKQIYKKVFIKNRILFQYDLVLQISVSDGTEGHLKYLEHSISVVLCKILVSGAAASLRHPTVQLINNY